MYPIQDAIQQEDHRTPGSDETILSQGTHDLVGASSQPDIRDQTHQAQTEICPLISDLLPPRIRARSYTNYHTAVTASAAQIS
jgi:hypothetical protein